MYFERCRSLLKILIFSTLNPCAPETGVSNSKDENMWYLKGISLKHCLCTILLLILNSSLIAQSRDASFSPNGSTLVYVTVVNNNSEVFVMDTNGFNNKQLTNTGCNNYYPFFSPDGSKIVFMSYPKGKTVICTINHNGSNFKSLTGENEENADPHWSPDGSQIIFYSARDGNNEIYIMNSDGSNPVRLTNNLASDQTPSISSDGKKIVFVSDRDGNTELYTMDLSGENIKRITFDPRIDRVPSWSPDSNKIIWYSRESTEVAGSSANSWNGAEIYVINAEGSERRQLTHNHFRDHGPVFSPNGKKIVFTSSRTGIREVFIMNRDGSDVRQLTYSKREQSK